MENFEFDIDIEEQAEDFTEEPPLYSVVILNDDITTMDFVVFILEDIFKKTRKDAITKMLEIHSYGEGEAGFYSKDIALSKSKKTEQVSQKYGFPLKNIVRKLN